MQPRRLKQDRHPAKLNNPLHLPSVQRHNVATLPLNVSAAHKRHSRTQRLASPPQHLAFLRITQIIHIPRIHIHSVHQPSPLRRHQMPLKRLNRNTPSASKGKSAAAIPSTVRCNFRFSIIDSIVMSSHMQL